MPAESDKKLFGLPGIELEVVLLAPVYKVLKVKFLPKCSVNVYESKPRVKA